MNRRQQIERDMQDIEHMLEAWGAFKRNIEPKNPLNAKTQNYGEFVGIAGGSKGAVVPVWALDMTRHHVAMIESVLESVPEPMAKAAQIYYLEDGFKTKGERLTMWRAATGGNKDQYYSYLESIRWAIWGLLNPREIVRR